MKVKREKRSGEVVLEVGGRDQSLLKASFNAPFSLKRILLPYDFSECSRKALRYAVAFAEQYSASVTLLNVSTLPTYGGGEFGVIDYTALEAEQREAARKHLSETVTEQIGESVKADLLVRVGQPAEEIVQAAKDLAVDMIVIATHGRTGFKHLLLGSVAEHVVRCAPCPVFVVREREHEFLENANADKI